MQLSELSFVVVAILYVCEKVGLFGWMGKFVHAKLPREKSMAIFNITKTKRYDVYIQSGKRTYMLKCVEVEFLDQVIVINRRILVPYYSVITLAKSKLNTQERARK